MDEVSQTETAEVLEKNDSQEKENKKIKNNPWLKQVLSKKHQSFEGDEELIAKHTPEELRKSEENMFTKIAEELDLGSDESIAELKKIREEREAEWKRAEELKEKEKAS